MKKIISVNWDYVTRKDIMDLQNKNCIMKDLIKL